MTYESYRMIFYIGSGAAALMLLISVILFFAFRIPSVIGDLTGSTAKKEIQNIREQNKSTGHRSYQPSTEKKKRVTAKINTAKTQADARKSAAKAPRASAAQAAASMPSPQYQAGAQQTVPLDNTVYNSNQYQQNMYGNASPIANPGSETTVLGNQQFENLQYANQQFGNETAVLGNQQFGGETTVLGAQQPLSNSFGQNGDSFFEIEKEITFIHTDETIR